MDATQEDPNETHLSYPEASTSQDVPALPAPQPRQVLTDRLYVGNLSPTVDEYVLLQVFSKFGKVAKLDFLFHKSGPLRGKPRGYAFVEFAESHVAAKALASTQDKLLRSRKLVVTYAQQAPLDQAGASSTKPRRLYNDAGKPTTLSMLKSVEGRRVAGTDDKIAKMEAKLRQLEQTSATSSSLPTHSSLPAKPVAASLAADSSSKPRPSSNPRRAQTSLPSLPLLPPRPASSPSLRHLGHGSASSVPPLSKHKTSALSGVVLKKRKELPPA